MSEGLKFSIQSPRFRCPKHGDHDYNMTVNLIRPDLNGEYCLVCYVEWLAPHVLKLETIERQPPAGSSDAPMKSSTDLGSDTVEAP